MRIGDVEFHVQKFDPFRALPMFFDLQREILPAAGHLLQATDDPVTAGAVEAGITGDDGLVQAFRALSEKLDGKTIMQWAERLLDEKHISVTINGRDTALDAATRLVAFRDPGDILELMYHVIRINFADFLLRWADRFGGAQKLRARLSAGSGMTSKPN
ncbi:phage tail assembly chaperone [Cupriavidus sp. D384]|uniref:phage tail assembly chaperone n=1 Tax=Cupriavidus sp. D384 TaxID=1538095 RepID=UPI0009ED0816|nr:hypothetical protein [Cupriavidus sp. D384]